MDHRVVENAKTDVNADRWTPGT